MEPLTLKTFKDKISETGFTGSDSKKWKYKGELPAIVDFYADRCGPCSSLSLTLEALAKAYQGKVDFYKVNIDQEPELAKMFDIRCVPTMLFIPINMHPFLSLGMSYSHVIEVTIKESLGV